MLLPSDVARLVLGYLQEEGLSSTSTSFIHESPSLIEYAEHSTDDGCIPACVFSLFGKNLITILNEYVAAKTKETSHEVPPIMTSLWKKLDFTLNQIKSLQNSPALSSSQRARSRTANMRIQQALTMSPTGSLACTTDTEIGSIITSSLVHTSHGMLGHSTPVNYSTHETRASSVSSTPFQIHDGSRLVTMGRDSPVHIPVPDPRITPAQMSPGRRKWDSPRRRGGGLGGSSGTMMRSSMTVSSLTVEPQPEQDVNENSSRAQQMVIQNAREKILGDRSLQEKLAENINKILASDPAPQTSKTSCSTMETDQSIDEILGLQGEIHMSDVAIHDILEQTESDPAFQALFDLFDYNKTRITEEPEDGVMSSSPEDNTAESSSTSRIPQDKEQVTAPRDNTSAQDTTCTAGRTKYGQEPNNRKSRKPAALSLLKKTILGPSSKRSRIEASTARLIISQQGTSSSTAAVNSNRGDKDSLFRGDGVVAPMDVQEPLDPPPPPPIPPSPTCLPPPLPPTCLPPLSTCLPPPPTTLPSPPPPLPPTCPPPLPSTCLPPLTSLHSPAPPSLPYPHPPPLPPSKTASQEVLEITKKDSCSSSTGLSASSATSAASETISPSNEFQIQEDKQAKRTGAGRNAQLSTFHVPTISISSQFTPAVVSPVPDKTFKTPSETVHLPHATVAVPSEGSSLNRTAAASSLTSPKSASSTPISFSTPVTAMPSPSIVLSSTPSQGPVDPGNIVSLKIIISDEQEEASCSTDRVLTQAISSISDDKIPTIFLTSPANSPAKAPHSTPLTASQDETILAVSSLQSSEVLQPEMTDVNSFSRKAGFIVGSPLTGTSQAQPSYIIQLPIDTVNPTLPGPTTSYILVTDPSATDPLARNVLVPTVISQGQPLPSSQYTLATPPRGQSHLTGSALVFQSPVGSMMLPVSVMGQNTASPGKFQMVSNELVTVPSPVPIKQPKSVKNKSPTVAQKQSTVASKTGTAEEELVSKVVKVVKVISTEKTGQQKLAAGMSPGHRRILFIDSAADPTPPHTTKSALPTTPPTTNTPVSPPLQLTEKANTAPVRRGRPAILGGNKPKRTIKPLECTDDTQVGQGSEVAKEIQEPLPQQQQQNDSVRKTPRKEGHKVLDQKSKIASVSVVDGSQPESSKKSESAGRSKSYESKHINEDNSSQAKPKESHSSRSASSDSRRSKSFDSKRSNDDDDSQAKPKESRSLRSATSDSRRSKSFDGKCNDDSGSQANPKESHSSRSSSSDSKQRSGNRKEKEETNGKEPVEMAPAKAREGRQERRASSQESPSVTANKENEVEGSRPEQQQQLLSPSSTPREFSPPPVTPPTPNKQSKSSKTTPRTPSKTSSLTKQASEMLQDFKGLNPPCTPGKGSGTGCPDFPLPRTPGIDRVQEDSVDQPRTPARQRHGRDGEGTPRHLLPPTTPELPACSPASEAGSENSINMAAHTLMILSRATIARTGTPLKNSLRQDGTEEMPPTSSKTSKKRKQPSPAPASPQAKKVSKRSSTDKKKEKKQKKVLDCFPDDLDVDKFLSSLHYDE